MTILTELAILYDRLADTGEAPRLGFSRERIGFELIFRSNGEPVALEPLAGDDPRRPGQRMNVPAAVNRSSGIKSNRLWDKTAYALGVTVVETDGGAGAGQGKRTADEHAAFVEAQRALIGDDPDPGLRAFLAFLDLWAPDRFAALGCNAAALDTNIVFRWEDDPKGPGFLHDRPAALARLGAGDRADDVLCLVTGGRGPMARLHPKIKGVDGAQSAGASLVSFNSEAYESFGARQGGNAPVSEKAAFAYGTALNALLDRNAAHKRRLKLGDTTVVFWAEGARADAVPVEDLFAAAVEPERTEDAEARLRADLTALAQGRPVEGACYDAATRIFMLGLAPNAARLSVRFWQVGQLGDLARNVLRFWEALHIEPAPWKGPPAAWSLLYETALRREAKNIPPRLGGELMRAVLGGQPLPRGLMTAVIGRIRADGDINGRRAAICKAVINGNRGQEVIPVALDRENDDSAYRLGRLFAMLEQAQRGALGREVNATIKDQYFAAASATPARVFPILIRNSTNHLSKMRKSNHGGWATNIEKEVQQIWSGLEPHLPRSLNLEAQGRFMAGYYHQSAYRAPKENVIDEGVDA